ncbi:MAG TPA: 3'-5' exonuclease, partial [Herpetosiphonaceae bacterium]
LTRISQPSGRRDIQAWAAKLVAQADGWVVLDTETTGTHASAEVVDVAVIGPDGATLLESLVRPQGRMNAAASQVHGIGPAQLRGAPSFDELYPELARVLDGKIALAYNVSFDGRILGFCCLQAGLPALAVSWGCVLAAFRAYAPGQRARLMDACAHFRLTPGTHRARADALATLHVLRAIAGAPPLPPARQDQA